MTVTPPPWILRRLPEVQVIRKGDEVTVIVPKDLHCALVGILIEEALRRAGLHPSQQ